MLKWFRKAARHPMIVAVVGGVAAILIGWKLTNTGDILWPVGIADAFKGSLKWLAGVGHSLVTPVPVPAALLYVIIGVAVVSVLYIITQRLSWSTEEIVAVHKSPVPVVPPLPAAPAIPADFKPSKLQTAIIFALMHRWQKQSNLKVIIETVEDVNPDLLPMMPEAHVSSDLEVLEAANVVSIDRLGPHYAYYHLTTLGREWTIRAIKKAEEKLPRPADAK